MDIKVTLNEIEVLSIEDQISFVQAIWDGIAEDRACSELTDVQKQELNLRMADADKDLGNVMTWEEIKASTVV